MIELKLTREPKRYNRTVRISGADAITPSVLQEVARICGENAASDENGDHAHWQHMRRDVISIIDGGLCPEEGVPVLGPYLMDYIVFPEKGDKVSIVKGAMVNSTATKNDHGPTEAAKKRTITVHRVSGGFIDHDRGIRISNPEVHWAGTGGYWHWTSLDNIESNIAKKMTK